MVLSPVLNAFIHRVSKAVLFQSIVLVAVWSSIAPTVLFTSYANSLDLFVLLYLIAAYIRLYVPVEKLNWKKHLVLAGIGWLAAGVVYVIVQYVALPGGFRSASDFGHLLTMNPSPLPVFIAVECLLFALAIPSFCNKALNGLAAASLAVYLIHCHPAIIKWVWKSVYSPEQWLESPWLWLQIGKAVLIVYSLCVVIDVLYQRTFRKGVYAITDYLLAPLISKVISLLLRICPLLEHREDRGERRRKENR